MEKKTDLQRAYDALNLKKKPYTTLRDYYYGNQPLKYSAERLKDAFDSPSVKFTQNWCAVVIDAVLDRLVFKGWDMDDETRDDILDAFYQNNNIQMLSADVHRNALITGESFIVFDKVDEADRAFYNDSRMVQIFYEPNDPNKKRFAAKWWQDDVEEITRLNLYYPDRIEKYATKARVLVSPSSFETVSIDDNPYNEIPVIHFNMGFSELDNIIPIQDAVNKTFSDMMVVGEFNAFKQRWVVTNNDLSNLKNNPKALFQFLKGGSDEEDTKVGEFDAADLGMFLDAMDKLANSIAIISRTPKHYFHDTGGNISGEALMVMESPLLKKIRQVQEIYSLGWDECARFVLRQQGKDADPSEITTIWDAIETTQPITRAQEIQTYVNLGVPLETMLRRAGWGADEIEQMKADQEEARKRESTVGQEVLEFLKNKQAQENATGADNQKSIE